MPIPWSQTLYSMPATAAAVTAASDTELVPNAVVTFQPNFFHIGTKLRIHASGVISTTSGSNTMTFTPKLGTAVICASFGAITMIASQTTQKWWLDLDIECRAEGAGTSTTFVGTGLFCASVALFASPAVLPVSGAIAAGTGVDGTVTQALHLNGTWSAGSNSITVEQYEVVVIQY